MLNVCRQNVISGVQRFNCRFLSSVVPELKIDDFPVKNEPVLSYLKGSKERKELEAALQDTARNCEDIPIVIGDEEIRTNDVRYQVMEHVFADPLPSSAVLPATDQQKHVPEEKQPHNHQKKVAKFYYATSDIVQRAIEVATAAQITWDRTPLEQRLKIWLRAADLMSSKYRMQLNAATMLGQSKTAIQAEIDSAAELIDFFRFNAFAAKEVSKYQPISVDPSVTLNSMRCRGINGFIAAISPFNFTAIGGNLAYTPALMGNGVLWKPSDTAMLSNYTIFKIVREAGLPPGVVNFVPADGPVFGDAITCSPHLGGINFTGSVATFNRLWTQVGQNINRYRSYPRLIGECGGKNYHFVHPSADVTSVIMGTIRSAFEYCGQKCSACSRMYVPQSLWPTIKAGLLAERDKLKIGDPTEFDSFTSAVIDAKAFDRIKSYIEHAKSSKNLTIIGGGKYDNSKGYFIEPTIVETTDPEDRIMVEEIFGPVLTVYAYKDQDLESTLRLVGESTPYALTGAVFATDQRFLEYALEELKYTAGNFYINDKSTGSVVGQQPFGGARMSGTNDKAGGPHYVLRWSSPQSIKETFVPLTEWKYPYMTN